ncbi:MarR family winged helix-turn-helix transcriptional regulator [Pseudonocardia sp. TRM90224]|uniref:MarR family winged helix-turn-helix transcriptional regulator n=1 Tax=Pseudonocardia sp. TRM90224 TaxID=2812678 RepID=UPI001E397FE7|nr:MarR family winged helix-turn-helix transcriptional regulator [Pseudonocardia sp. TRM90224]
MDGMESHANVTPNPTGSGSAAAPTDEGRRSDLPAPALSRNRSGSVRLRAGQLRGMIEDHLYGNPGDFTPVDLGNKLRRSPGAIANALERLVEQGTVDRMSEKPRRYRHAEATDPTLVDDESPVKSAAVESTGEVRRCE